MWNLNAIKDLDDISVLTLDVLAATWPREYRKTGSQIPFADLDEMSPPPADKDEFAVDLSGRNLSYVELLQALRDVAPFTRLDISRNTAVDKGTLSEILKEHRLEWLNIDGCSISKRDLIELLTTQASLFRGIEAIIHPVFLSLDNLEGKSTGIPSVFRFYYGDTNCIALPFFGIDQIFQSLIDVATAHNNFKAASELELSNLQSSFGCAPRNDGLPWAERVLQMIPPELSIKDVSEGYSFIFSADKKWAWRGQPFGGGYHYGIILPGGERKFVDIATFLRHLEENGWPKAKNEEAIALVVELFSDNIALLEDFDAAMKELKFTDEK